MGSTIKKGTTGLWRLDFSTVLWRLGEGVFSTMEAGGRGLQYYGGWGKGSSVLWRLGEGGYCTTSVVYWNTD